MDYTNSSINRQRPRGVGSPGDTVDIFGGRCRHCAGLTIMARWWDVLNILWTPLSSLVFAYLGHTIVILLKLMRFYPKMRIDLKTMKMRRSADDLLWSHSKTVYDPKMTILFEIIGFLQTLNKQQFITRQCRNQLFPFQCLGPVLSNHVPWAGVPGRIRKHHWTGQEAARRQWLHRVHPQVCGQRSWLQLPAGSRHARGRDARVWHPWVSIETIEEELGEGFSRAVTGRLNSDETFSDCFYQHEMNSCQLKVLLEKCWVKCILIFYIKKYIEKLI